MEQIKKDILIELAKYPKGIRFRYLSLTSKYFKSEIIRALHELSNENAVRSVMKRDLANMEIYDLWFLN